MNKVTFQAADFGITVKALKKRVEANEFVFENAVQRGFVWDDERKSFLIDSILQGYPVPPLFAKKNEQGVYDMLDGKQRSNALIQFIDDKYELTGMSDALSEFEGMTFSQLDEEDKDTILDYNLTIKYFDGISDDEVRELFFRLNNGKPLTNFEQVKAKSKSLAIVDKIVDSCEVFNGDKIGKKMSADKKLELAFKSWVMLYDETPSFEKKQFNPVITNAVVTEAQQKEMKAVFDRIYNCYTHIQSITNDDTRKMNEKIRKRIVTPSHFLSIIPFVKRSIDENRTVEAFSAFLMGFYDGTRRASHDDRYNDYASRGSAKASSIKVRNEELEKEYVKRFGKVSIPTKVEKEIEHVEPKEEIPEEIPEEIDVEIGVEEMKVEEEASIPPIEDMVNSSDYSFEDEPHESTESEESLIAGLFDSYNDNEDNEDEGVDSYDLYDEF